MPYKAALTKNFLRELKKLPENVRKRVLTAIDELIRNPFSGVRLRGELKGKWRRRAGKYRIIYRIDQTSQLIIFLDVGLRKKIYE
ncbi:type II toxin-antitoxin system RelE/ParE family toxin [Candidatus Bathyarchaeota archaeon]|nr:type II toxin-antitoxin system RelE/ParE family toxin [Candidatus Bathyarchaeota archaeon]